MTHVEVKVLNKAIETFLIKCLILFIIFYKLAKQFNEETRNIFAFIIL